MKKLLVVGLILLSPSVFAISEKDLTEKQEEYKKEATKLNEELNGITKRAQEIQTSLMQLQAKFDALESLKEKKEKK